MITADCPSAVRELPAISHEIRSGAEFNVSALHTQDPNGVVQLIDNENPGETWGSNPIAVMAGRQIEGYVAVEEIGGKSRIEMLCADEAQVNTYIGDRVLTAVNPQKLVARVKLHPAPGFGASSAVLIDRRNREFAFKMPQSEPGGVAPSPSSQTGGLRPEQPGGVSSEAPQTGGVSSAS